MLLHFQLLIFLVSCHGESPFDKQEQRYSGAHCQHEDDATSNDCVRE